MAPKHSRTFREIACPVIGRHFANGTVIVLLVACACLTGCNPRASLAPELAAISCPADRAEHVSTRFAKAEVTFVCVTKEVVKKPALLRCDPNVGPQWCQDSFDRMVFSRLPGGKLVEGAPFNARGYQPGPVTDPETDRGSMVEVSFYDKRPGKSDYEVGPRRYLRKPGQQRIPAGFTLVNGPLCDDVSNALSRGSCALELKSASLYWYITVSMPRPSGWEIDDSLYDKDLQMWLDLLGKMVVDPKG